LKEALSGFLTSNDLSNAKGLPTKPNHHSLLTHCHVKQKMPLIYLAAFALLQKKKKRSKTKQNKIARLGNASACNYYVSFSIASIVCLNDWLITLKTLEQLLF